MCTLYLKESKDLDSLQEIILYFEASNRTDENEQVVIFNTIEYKVYDTEAIEEKDNKIYGYVEISDKPDKKCKVKLKNIKASIGKQVAVQKDDKDRKIVGYIKAIDTEGNIVYLGLMEKGIVLLPIIICGIVILLLCGLGLTQCGGLEVGTPTVQEKPVFKEGNKGTGEIENEAVEFGEQPTFRMILNCTPTVENGEMNLRIESPAEDNKDLGFVVKVYLLQKMDSEKTEVLEEYGNNPVQVYESPIVYANENIENCPLDVELESGVYAARAVYDIYDMESNLLGQTATRLEIRVN
ncbi:MAG: hypothetical protein IJ272_09595 [Clostridia bacterium]|nr:hypothetical protein [Clostridia bacterium]